ncbi:hypothetical protein BGZ99_007346 [Dissophora globulifera]|uniref:Uncharacterized protein n=1 Tax=Dissophora globulifera TaxID=979702 RepID=A0A9P6RCC0_9FUNG|nr:hypothetical protein BGZ99_007346 [Dissophora globulifera]
MDIDCSDSLSHDYCLSDDSSDDTLSDQDLRHHFRHSQVLRAGMADTEESNNNSGDDDDDDDNDDDADKNGVTLLGSFFSMGSSSLVPNLGPFSLDKAAETLVWSDLPPLSELYCLQRIELYDIHHKFDSVAIVDFLKLHDSAYHTIREIKIGGPDDLGRSTHSGVIQVLQALRTVKVLDMIEWREAIQFLDQIPTIHLEILLLGNVRMTAEEVTAQSNVTQDDDEAEEKEQQHPQIQTLMRSRRLRELRMPVLIDGLFRWAVQERRQRLRHTMPHSSPCISLTPSTSAKPSSPPPRWDYGPNPMPLEKVYLSGTSTGPLISTLIDVADAFRDSIRVLQSTSWMDSTETLSCCLSLSWTWHLPQLQVLDLQGEIAYRFRIQALQHCPLLRVLSLSLPHSVLTQSSQIYLIPEVMETTTNVVHR